MTDNVTVEVYCGSVDDAIEAEAGGADRVELNSCLFLGGLTPSLGTIIEAKKRIKIPIMVMIRPRGGGFCYTEAEMNVMERDVQEALKHGADGIVFGILEEDGTIDIKRCKRIIDLAGDKEVVFHRAFDVVPDPFQAVDQLIELGVDRILTKGQENRIEAGIELVRKLIEYAGDKIQILPGGIRDYNYEYVIKKTGCTQVHISSFKRINDYSTSKSSHLYFGSALYPPEDNFQIVDRQGIKCLSKKIKGHN